MACESSRNTSTFQSTLSMRRATAYIQCKRTAIAISIHALHEESDLRGGYGSSIGFYFNPRSP